MSNQLTSIHLKSAHSKVHKNFDFNDFFSYTLNSHGCLKSSRLLNTNLLSRFIVAINEIQTAINIKYN